MKKETAKDLASKYSRPAMPPEKSSILPLYITLIISASVLILVNYYSINLLSALRAGICGQTIYEKSKIEENRNLVMFIQTEDERYYLRFKEAFEIHQRFLLARHLLASRAPEQETAAILIKAGLDPKDVDDVWFLLHTLRSFNFIKQSMTAWSVEDRSIQSTGVFAADLHAHIAHISRPRGILLSGNRPVTVLSPVDRSELTKTLFTLSEPNVKLKARFSEILSTAARKINMTVFYFNLIFVLLVIGNTTFITRRLLKTIRQAGSDLLEKNLVLQRTNIELDKFIYSASHDLRSPISSLKGLIEIIEEEASFDQLPYFSMMRECIEKQDRFIKEIINYSANMVVEIKVTAIDLSALVDEVIGHKSARYNEAHVTFEKDIQLPEIYSDPDRLTIILNSTIANAIQYRDPLKEHPLIQIRATAAGPAVEITITDNGIGIRPENIDKIFDMFFVTDHRNRGSGVGLYNVKETVEKMGGSISVCSAPGEGTSFTICLPRLTV